jgi:hypothetical protein
MRAYEIITEAREAPLYHFTSERSFYRIISGNVLNSPDGTIYFTRDYARQFLPHAANFDKGSWGFRVDQDRLRKKFGKKLKAGGQRTPTKKEIDQWLEDPENRKHWDDMKAKLEKDPNYSATVIWRGLDLASAIKGTLGQKARWESEEHLYVDKIENFLDYVTGFVYAGGKQGGGLMKRVGEPEYGKRSADKDSAGDELARLLQQHFYKTFDLRDKLIKIMIERNIPFVYQRQDFDAKEIKSKIIDLYRQQKRKREQEEAERNRPRPWVFFANKAATKKVTVEAPDQYKAQRIALTDMKDQFPEGVWGYRHPETGYEIYYTKPITHPDHMGADRIDRERSTDPMVKPRKKEPEKAEA